jgi:hypothetical protein
VSCTFSHGLLISSQSENTVYEIKLPKRRETWILNTFVTSLKLHALQERVKETRELWGYPMVRHGFEPGNSTSRIQTVYSVPGYCSIDRCTCTRVQVSCWRSALRPHSDSFTPQIRVFWDVTLSVSTEFWTLRQIVVPPSSGSVVKWRHYCLSKRLESLTHRRRWHPRRCESSVRPL